MKKQLRIAAVTALLVLGGFSASAQKVNPNGAPVTPTPADFTKDAKVVLGESGGSVMVIDNKGTRKYLQSKNGLTMFTNKTPSGGVVTTWQLGGTLTDNTYIDVSGKIFAIKGLNKIDTALATTGTTPDIKAANIAATASTIGASGFTLMVRDEKTGETKKMLASDLLGVKGFHVEKEATAFLAVNTGFTIPVTGFISAGTNKYQVSVFRNGAKLISGKDYTFATDGNVIVKSPDFAIYNGDYFEVSIIK